ncbi:hypothetical protein DL89DRAFT_268547 [Linderina pennispora]|uniref:FHA domain-containing protein n=1 Tax=Linderina pennispora TaxID=61395 RepID=A0A1Y1W694_9FUNG|nr:uncharacterized protein DL89DRAFT_268547 [Linderina pennispora]ORX68766.1 hypothetical protein DL89DRAFT_268547 [Linderina pennispora]
MSSPFEDALNAYLETTQPTAAPQLLDGFAVSADPRYAYNAQTGLWLDIASNTVSYYDAKTCTYVAADTQDNAQSSDWFEGVVRLVVVDSACFSPGQVADVDIVEGLSIGRDEHEASITPHLRVPEISVSRFHARIYAEDITESETVDNCVEVGSEDGEIEEQEDDDAKYSEDGECSDHEVEAKTDPHRLLTLYVVDQGSTHGTFINEERLSEPKCASKPHVIAHMDRVSFGQCVFELHVHEQWACARCSASEHSEIPTRSFASAMQPEAKSTKLVPDIQQERIENLRALKRKYMSNKGYHRHTTGKTYTDRAKLRRMHQPAQLPAQPYSDTDDHTSLSDEGDAYEFTGNNERAGLGLQNMSDQDRREYKVTRLTRERYMSS